jgi:hypothetical protein
MSCLSVLVENGPSVVVANPIYFVGELDFRKGSKLVFEVLAADADSIRRSLHRLEHFSLAPEGASFTGTITSVQFCISTTPALALMRDKLAVRCELAIFSVGIPTSKH